MPRCRSSRSGRGQRVRRLAGPPLGECICSAPAGGSAACNVVGFRVGSLASSAMARPCRWEVAATAQGGQRHLPIVQDGGVLGAARVAKLVHGDGAARPPARSTHLARGHRPGMWWPQQILARWLCFLATCPGLSRLGCRAAVKMRSSCSGRQWHCWKCAQRIGQWRPTKLVAAVSGVMLGCSWMAHISCGSTMGITRWAPGPGLRGSCYACATCRKCHPWS
jgi:hypothetical protein